MEKEAASEAAKKMIGNWASVLPVVAPAVGAAVGGGMKAVDLYGHRLRHGKDAPTAEEQHLSDHLQEAQAKERKSGSVGDRTKVEELRHQLELAKLDRQSPIRGVARGARQGLGYGMMGSAATFVPALMIRSALSKKGSARSKFIEKELRDLASDYPRWSRYIPQGAAVGAGVGALTGGAAGAITADPGDRLRRGAIGATGGAVAGAGAGAAARGLDWNRVRGGIAKLRSIYKAPIVRDDVMEVTQDILSHMEPRADLGAVVVPLGVGAGLTAGMTSPRGRKEKK